MPEDIITPNSPAETINYYLAAGDVQGAREWQAYQVMCGRIAARSGESFNSAAPAAWQTGYAEALQDLEH